jgi:L,D-transpeptidase YcbB
MNMQRPKTLWLSLIATLLVSTNIVADPAPETGGLIQRVRDHIATQITQKSEYQNLICQGEVICGLKLMPIFYQDRHFAPVWFSDNGLLPAAQTLIDAIKGIDQDGLYPDDYHTSIINLLLSDYNLQPMNLNSDRQAAIWADLDLLLTDAFLLLGTHLSGGRIDPETLHADWIVPEKAINVMDLLHTVAADTHMEQIIDRLRPSHAGYLDLRRALLQMRQWQARGGWPAIAQGATLRPGVQDSRIPLLRERLHISGDLDTAEAPDRSDHYDERLSTAVQNFQQRHGLDPDGIIGNQTIKVLNVTASQRVRQIELNLERWRWLPRTLSERYILVNTADFNLQVVENRRKVLQMRVGVGTPARRTPVFSAPITYMVLNPYWTVPHTLAVEDILPKLAKGVDYLTPKGFKVFNSWNENAEAIDPGTINWTIYSKSYFPFRLRQDPGPSNALGRIKFMLPNKFSVYLHDTPQRGFFNQVHRDVSSGCIRVENAPALARYLLSNDPAWTPETFNSTLSSGKRLVVWISNPIPVHLLYMTAWVDDTGILQFRNDIYDRDRDLNNALLKRQPAPLPPLTATEGPLASY